MPDFKRPGVYVSETLTPSRAIPSPSTSTAAFIGEHYRGPTAAVLCSSWGDFVANFGGFPPATPALANPWLSWAVYNFFNNGGSQCWVSRTVSATGGAASTHTFLDQAAVAVATLALSALNVGTWGNAIYIDILARGTGTGRFDINVYFGGTSGNNIVEKWTDMSMVASDPRYVVNIINSSLGGSLYITAIDQHSPTAAPNNAPAPVAQQALSGGTDPGSPTTTERQNSVTAGTSPLDLVDGLLNLNLPGESTSTVLNAAITYAQNRGNIFVVVDPPSGQTPAQAIAFQQGLTPSSYAALYYPWVNAIDPASAAANATKLQPPGGFVLGQYTRNDAQRGVWHAPAGLTARLQSTVGLERKLSNADLDSLNSANVNAIKTWGSGLIVWGTRTFLNSLPSQYVPIRRTLNYIEQSLKDGTTWAVFEPNDALLWTMLAASAANFLAGLWQAGGLKGQQSTDAYYVVCDSTINTPQSIAQGVVNLQVGVAVQYPAEFVSILIGQWQGGSSATVTA